MKLYVLSACLFGKYKTSAKKIKFINYKKITLLKNILSYI